MSESIVRKIQPFTIGTKLSVPAVSKCPDFTESFLPSRTLDNCKLRHNLNDQVSLYLSRTQVRSSDRHFLPEATRASPAKCHQEEMAEEDRLNRNAASPTAASRSIRKITISSTMDSTRYKLSQGSELPKMKISSNSENINNNNNISTSNPKLPRIVGVSCENKPSSHFKVLLRKDTNNEKQVNHTHMSALPLGRDKYPSVHQTPVFKACSPKRDLLKGNSSPCEPKDVPKGSNITSADSDLCFTQQSAVFNREISQAEAWIKGKLQDLKEGCNIQKCPLKDWEEVSQTLQRDLKDFENTLIQLNQMGEQLMCKLNPTSDLVKKQLSQLRDQWQTLKQTAANQSKALGGARSLQEFNTKVDRLEAWMKEKEEEQSLTNLLRENVDKMQLTRRILDLKQDEQLYRTLHEEINQLALKLEKQGKTESKNISTRRKHINKMWLKVQSLLKDYHENLQLALEVSSFYQQADNIVCSINNMRKSLSETQSQENGGDGEIRDIASQIMMLDVSVSQLSNLHPALAVRVTQKQAEVKDCWALLQKSLRTEKPAQPHSSSHFTREDGDPMTPSVEPQCNVGIEPQRIMGKDVKEEQNRLKGFVGGRESGNTRKPSDGQEETPPITDKNLASDVIERHQMEGERKEKVETQPGATVEDGHPRLHTQLQKFTVSADKTLSWLKDNVAIATRICCTSSPNSLETAKRCQAALQQDILSNRARIEVVKREGRSLVRAQHPGSAKIEEFLCQLEILWEELKRRHQKNSLVLQGSEELNYRAVRTLQALGSLEAWLEAVELSIRQSSLVGDPESMSVAEQESSLLEREMAARALELRSLREEVDTLSGQRHLHTELLPARMEEVEKKYHKVQNVLCQQSSKLQDTRMLTEFLERVELEESHYSTIGQPLCSEIEPSLLALRGGGRSEPLIESIGDPVEELTEAVEMLNDTARERGRTLSHDHSIQELISRHASVSARIEKCVRRCAELAVDVLEMEREMAVRCEPERSDLDGLQLQHDQIETDYHALMAEVKAMENLAARLADLCPERVYVLGVEVQGTLQAWIELGKSVEENRDRLRQFEQLRHFFRNYLAMISWTEDTRSCIFSESALLHGRDNQEPLADILDQQIEQKFEEFDELAAAGKKLIDEEHHLTKMIKERMEELRSMLGWILVHWRNQKDQWITRRRTIEPQVDAIYSEATVCTPPSLQDSQRSAKEAVSEDVQKTPGSPPPSGVEDAWQLDDGYEVMSSISPRSNDSTSATEEPSSPYLVLKEPSTPLGGTVNLILSFNSAGDSQLQVQNPVRKEEVEAQEPVHRVSTYLHVKDNMAVSPVYESITLPRLKTQSPTYTSSGSASSPHGHRLQMSPNFLQTLPKNSTTSIFSSLKRKSKKRKKKRDARRHTIQRIMGEEPSDGSAPPSEYEPVSYDTHTWPLKDRKKRKSKNSKRPELLDYVRNPLNKDIDAECTGDLNSTALFTQEKKPAIGPTPPSGHVKNHCRFLSLGSVLSFDLPKDMSLIPSIQDVITIGPTETRRTDAQHQNPNAEKPAALSTFKLARSPPTRKEEECKPSSQSDVTFKIDHHGTHTIHVDAISIAEDDFPPPPPPVAEDFSFEENQTTSVSDLTKVQPQCLSGINRLHEEDEHEWNETATKLVCSEDHPNDTPNSPTNKRCKENSSPAISSHCTTTTEVIHICPSAHTLIQDLNGHEYHKTLKPACTQQEQESPLVSQSHSSHIVLNFKANGREDSVDSGHSSSGSFKLCGEAPYLDTTDYPPPRRALGRLVSMEMTNGPRESDCPKPKNEASRITDTVHPDHQQFEQEEEELEDIWNHSNSYRQSMCSDIMYEGYQSELEASTPPGEAREPSPKEQAVLYRNLVTASAPNLLVAEFRLPPHIQSMLGYGKEPSPNEEVGPLGKGERRSWAAFPLKDQSCRQAALVNETASDSVKLPEVEDQQKYIYHYREQEEEEEEHEEEVVEEGCTGGLKDQSMSLLSVHMGLDRSLHATDMQGQRITTGGHSSTINDKSDFPSMEGTLERKHKLQLGGKKAPCRTWNSYHAVLYRQTLCFYQDRKDTLGSSVTSLPLNLCGAECTPVPEYTKKPNCFSLRLHDGSEYLLSASSRFMMKKWMLKIQANTGSSESRSIATMLCRDPVQDVNSSSGTCHCRVKCHCSLTNGVISTLRGQNQTGKAKEIVILTRDNAQVPQWHQGKQEDFSLTSCSDAGHRGNDTGCNGETMRERLQGSVPPCSSLSQTQDWQSSNKHRSHSFTSATYQRIKPVTLPSAGGGQDSSSSYSVTLFIGDGERPPVCKSTAVPQLCDFPQDCLSDLPLRNYASLPRPRNKSVFKKFFGKKE
ncbi:uncharacterized protein mymx [Chanos chanos]|uniref:Uncharacterized protein mymx n=1 Tax=Chanos chanos TaxID=29144 RepID=A0A6J2V741_CHACN|nr:uncharacterized protein LOC115810338 [Chanos chanos]